jgi:hypothetical protein
MNARALLLPFALLTALLFACAKPINDGGACFQSSECRGGSICVDAAFSAGTENFYGKYCMKVCEPEQVRCASEASCLESADVLYDLEGIGGSSGAGGEGGMGGEGGIGGIGGIGGVGGAAPETWLCLPGQLENPEYFPRDFGFVCDFSLDCELGGVCVCIPGATCEGEGRNGPTCQRICDPTLINQCPTVAELTPQCTDLGDGRGFCDPTTIMLDP